VSYFRLSFWEVRPRFLELVSFLILRDLREVRRDELLCSSRARALKVSLIAD